MNGLCSHERLELALAGSLNADDEAILHVHLQDCELCAAKMERLSGGELASREIAAMLMPDDLDDALPLREECSTADFIVDHLEPSDDLAILGRLGGYDVLDIIGRGGMGVVLKGYDRELKRFVAIKALAPHLAHSALARKRFAREAQAAAAVVNLHVIAIHQVQPNGQLPFLVMPLLTGESLAQRLKARGTLELNEILRIGMQAAEGLAAAHGQGLIHRDVKPANILLEKGVERAVLTDFGLARAADDVSLTRWGIIAGTPEYMSPEQARGETLDGRSDLFSLGCVLYEMATGVSPFQTDSTMATLRRIVDEQPATMASLVPELPPWYCRIVERLLSKDPAQRFASASEVSHLLERCLSHLQQPSSVPLPASLVPHATGRRSFFNPTRIGLIAMLGTPGLILLGMVVLQAPEAPDISGHWTSDEWGFVVLEAKQPGQYDGTFTGSGKEKPAADNPNTLEVKVPDGGAVLLSAPNNASDKGKSCTLDLKWSKTERRFNGMWKVGEDRHGKISLRLVEKEIRGAWTTSKDAKVASETPELAELKWVRSARRQVEPDPSKVAINGNAKIDKTNLPKVSNDVQSPTTVLNGLVSGGGLIERIEEGTIHLKSGDRISVQAGTAVLVPVPGGSISILSSDLLEPGMAISYSIRDGKTEKLILVGIVEQVPSGKSVFDTIKVRQLQKGGEIADSIDGRNPIHLAGKDGEVLIKIGETKLIQLPKLMESVEWRTGDFKPEVINDIEPFDYVLVQWRDNGRITFTCYATPTEDAPDGDADSPKDAKK